MLATTLTVVGVLVLAVVALLPFFMLLFLGEFALGHCTWGVTARFVLIMLKSLRRNLLRTSLTYLAIFVLVIVVTTVWSVLHYLDDLMTDKASNVKVIVSEKWGGSGLPFAYAAGLSAGAADASHPGDVRPLDSMTWQFYIGTVDPVKKTREGMVFVIGLEPSKLLTIMDELIREVQPGQRQPGLEEVFRQQLAAGVAQMERNKRGVIMGRKRLERLEKRVGDSVTVTGVNYQKLDLEFEIVAVLPDSGNYDEVTFMNRDYLNDALSAYEKKNGAKHALADKSLNIVWLQAADQQMYGRIASQIESSSYYNNPAVKCETLSSAVATVMESYRDLVWGMRWLLSPALLITMALIVANAISLSVRERRIELAVLKVMGFRPGQILALVLGEAVLIGVAGGFLSTALAYVLVNIVLRTVNPMAMAVPAEALWWGPALGAGTALAGSLLPAMNAGRVKVSEVFARVT